MTIALASIGWAGAVGVLVAYLLLLRRITSADSPLYLSLNFLGSACLALSTCAAHAWPSAAVNLIWLAIGFAPLVRALAKFHGWPAGLGEHATVRIDALVSQQHDAQRRDTQ